MGRAAFGVWVLLTACGRFGFTSTDPDSDAGSGGDGGGDSALVDATVVPGVEGVVVRADSYGGTGNEEAYDIAIAGDGAIVIAGTTDGGTFMIGSDTIASAGGEDILIAVFEANGTPRWSRRFGAAGSDRAQAVAVDAAALYVCGLFSGTFNFGGGNVSSTGGTDVFVASYALADGAYRWARAIGGSAADFCYDVAVAPNGNIAATGYYEGPVNFGTGALPAVGMAEAFVAMFNATTGNTTGARGFASAGYDSGQGVAFTSTGNAVVTGRMGGAIDFGDGPKGTGGSFVVEVDSSRTHVWSTALDLMTTWDIDVDQPRNRILLASRTAAGLDLGKGPLPAAGGNDSLVISFNSARELEWYAAFGGDLSDIGLGVSVDANGNAYSIGLGGSNVDFGQGLVTGNGMQDIWVTGHDINGNVFYGALFGGAPQDRGYATAVAPDGALYISGRWAGTTDFGTGSKTAMANDLFILRIE